MCLSIGAPKIIYFPFVPNEKIIILGLPRFGHIPHIMCLNIGTPKNHHFPFGPNGKVVVLGVPTLTVMCLSIGTLKGNKFSICST